MSTASEIKRELKIWEIRVLLYALLPTRKFVLCVNPGINLSLFQISGDDSWSVVVMMTICEHT